MIKGKRSLRTAIYYSYELNTIKGGFIWYKKPRYTASMKIFGNTAILLNDNDLLAVVGGNEVTHAFMITEVYLKENSRWKTGSLTFSTLKRYCKKLTELYWLVY